MKYLNTESQTHSECNIVSVGKRRDGGTRYWCLEHKADATAKYGIPADHCRYAHVPKVKQEEKLLLSVDDYEGGVGLWGAVPPIYDTTLLPLDKGIHVHARKAPGKPKDIDQTYRSVIVHSQDEKHEVTDLDAIYFMVSSIFDFKVYLIKCSKCGYPHLDKDWFSVHPHQSHLCAGCGKNFRDNKISVGNPIAKLNDLKVSKVPKFKKADRSIRLCQRDYPGGIQIWGANPSLLWTSDEYQETGIHIHCYDGVSQAPVIDDTFDNVVIDGITLDEDQVRVLMAQMSLPHLENRVIAQPCPHCNHLNFDNEDKAFTPTIEHTCENCNKQYKTKGRLKKVILNPLLIAIKELENFAVREPQKHDLELIPETI